MNLDVKPLSAGCSSSIVVGIFISLPKILIVICISQAVCHFFCEYLIILAQVAVCVVLSIVDVLMWLLLHRKCC